ncbi:TraB/GumN family protein [Kordiimonas lipolytica]|uniref:TraB/GumN family protein n=1 Tax=Kordiimonas lipolytica TaxID=1662421 RepID=A0ABV8U6R0_9PROT|nr:TraB/GumN family protein [Kordiimonas lipolytica]
MKRLVLILISIFGLSLQAAAAPALWRVADDDTEVYIFGTLHMLQEGTTWANAGITNAFSTSDALVVELDDRELEKAGPLFQDAGKLPLGMTMRQIVGDGIYNDVRRLARQMDLPADTFQNVRPWYAGMSLTIVSLTKMGYDPASGVDQTLISEALRLRKPILGIETAAQQAGLFAKLTPAQDKALLVDALRQSVNVKAYMTELQSAWLEGDEATLDNLLNGELMKKEGLGQHLLYGRNEDWARQLTALMNKPGRFFVAVGTAHVVGDKSLIMFLSQQRQFLERVQ